jgi:phenylacetate-CoA ligase
VEVECSSREKDSSETVKAVAHHIKSRIGVTAAVVLKQPGQVPRSQGKAVRVRDLRPKATA